MGLIKNRDRIPSVSFSLLNNRISTYSPHLPFVDYRTPLRKESFEDALEILGKFDIVIVVDDSGSMQGPSWEEVGYEVPPTNNFLILVLGERSPFENR